MDKKDNSLSCFAVSFRQGFTSPNVPLITLSQNDREFIFLLDTGSEHNVIDKNALSYIEHVPINDKEMPKTLSGVGGQVTVSACSITFKCDNKEYTENFVVNDLSAALRTLKQETGVIMHGIIGSKFLMENKVVLDYHQMIAYSKQ